MKSNVVLSAVLGILLLCSIGVAKDYEVSVSVTPKEVDIGPCDIASFDVKVDNMGELSDSYSVVVEGIPEDWYSLSHDSVTVDGDSSRMVYLFITPYCMENGFGTYNGSVSVVGNANDTDAFTLNVIPEHEIKVSLPEEIPVCLCEGKEFTANIENLKDYEEVLTLSVSGDASDFVVLEETSLTLGPKESKSIKMEIEPDCDFEKGVYSLVLEARSSTSYAKSSASSSIRMDMCYDFDVVYPEEVRVCSNVSTSFTIEIENTGTKDDVYGITVGEWSASAALKSRESDSFELSFFEEEIGAYDVLLTVKSNFREREITLKFVVERCYGVDLVLEQNEFSVEVGRGLLVKPKVTNIGTKADVFDVLSDVEWVSIKPSQVSLEPDETEEVYVYYSPPFELVGSHETILTVRSSNSEDSESILINVAEEGVPTTTEPVTTTTEAIPATTTIPAEEALVRRLWENIVIRSLIIAAIIGLIITVLLYLVVM